MILLYELGLIILAALALPKLLFDLFFRKKYRKSLLARLGVGFPNVKKEGQRLVWVHAVSVGEVKAIAALIEALKKRGYCVLLTTVTETGQSEAKKTAADFTAYLPIDFYFLIHFFVKKAAPDLLIIAETDFWLNLMEAVKRRGGKIAVVNGKVSQKSFTRFCKLPFFAARLFSKIDVACMQNEVYAKRISVLGAPTTCVTGNLKIEGVRHQPQKDLRSRLKCDGKRVITLGSTHSPEEEILLDALTPIANIKVFIVPRHPERFNEVEQLLKKRGGDYGLWSKNQFEAPYVLVDKMGMLCDCYSISDIAFVGGSLTPKVGGHNIIEPLFYGVPALFGPYMHAQPDFTALVEQYGAGKRVAPDALKSVFESILNDHSLREKMSERGKILVEENGGGLEKTLLALKCGELIC